MNGPEKHPCGRDGCTMRGQVHTKCHGHNRAGQPCGKSPVPGATVCGLHGGKAPQVKAAAAERVAEEQARRDVELFSARRDIHPAEALLELVHWTAGEVDYWRARVRQVAADDEDALTWGVVREKSGGEDHGTTREARPNVAYAMLVDASNRLERYASAALKAGVEERRVRLAESQGAAVADAIRGILADLQLTPAQQVLVGEVVPRRLRALAGGPA